MTGRHLDFESMDRGRFDEGMARLIAGDLALRGEFGGPPSGPDDDVGGGEFAVLHPNIEPPGRGGAVLEDLGRKALAAA